MDAKSKYLYKYAIMVAYNFYNWPKLKKILAFKFFPLAKTFFTGKNVL